MQTPKSTIFVFSILVFLSAISTGFSQTELGDGYFISPKGDTVRGFIRYESWIGRPVYLYYSADREGKGLQKLDHTYFKEFYIESINKSYKLRKIGVLIINLHQSYRTVPSIQTRDSSFVFLEEVATGPGAVLWLKKDFSGDEYFFLEKRGKMTELINRPFMRTIKDRRYRVIYDKYLDQLPELLDDVTDFKMALPRYEKEDLRKFIQAYNEAFTEKR